LAESCELKEIRRMAPPTQTALAGKVTPSQIWLRAVHLAAGRCRRALALAIDTKPQRQREHVRIALNGPPSRAGKW
jgi:hypothetical protein